MYFRFYTSADLVEFAKAHRIRERAKTLDMKFSNGVEKAPFQFLTHWNDYLEKDDEKLCREMYGNKLPHKFYGDRSDLLAMRASYVRLAESKLRRFDSFNIRGKLTGGAPVLDFIIADMKQSYGHHAVPSLEYLEMIQARRCVSSATLSSGHAVHEVTIGKSSTQEVEEAIKFFNHHYSKEESECPIGIINFDVESVHISPEDWNKLPASGKTSSNRVVFARQPGNGVPAKQLPVRMILGGLNWTLNVRLDVDTSQDRKDIVHYQINNSLIQDNLRDFLENLPTGAGCNVNSDIQDVERYLSRLGAPNFRFKNGWIELSVLAAAAGFHSKRLTMFNLNFQLLGGILSKNNSKADGLWSLEWKDLPDEYRTYIIGDSRAGYSMYVVLYCAIKLNLAPDPEPLCIVSERSQAAVAKWFGDMIRVTFKGLEVHRESYAAATTRVELARSIRLREPKWSMTGETESSEDDLVDVRYTPGKLRSAPPERVEQFAKLIPRWPSPTFGNVRYLHHPRIDFFTKCGNYRKLDLHGVDNIWMVGGDNNHKYDLLTYAQTPYPVDLTLGTNSPHLAADPNLPFPPADFNVNTVLNCNFSKLAEDQGRPARYITLEYLRLRDTEDTVKLLSRASEEAGELRVQRFWIPALSRYEEIRTSFYYRTNTITGIPCGWAEAKIEKAVENVRKQSDQDMLDLEQRLSAAKRRLEEIQKLEQDDYATMRIRLQKKLPPRPMAGKVPTEAQQERKRKRRQQYRQKKRLRMSAVTSETTVSEAAAVPDEHEESVASEDVQEKRDQLIITTDVQKIPQKGDNSFYQRVVNDFNQM